MQLLCGTAQQSPEHTVCLRGLTQTLPLLRGSTFHQTTIPELTQTPRQWGWHRDVSVLTSESGDINGKRFATTARQVFGIETQGSTQAATKASKSLIFPLKANFPFLWKILLESSLIYLD